MRGIEVQHADQAGPFAAPVGDGEDGSAMGVEAVQDMMAILPDRLDHHQRRVAAGWRGTLPCRASGYR